MTQVKKMTTAEKRKAEKQARVDNANQLLQSIASHGRNFFQYKNGVSHLEVDKHGKIWFIDAYENKRIYTHYRGRWRNFSEGGTLRSLVEVLRDYISKGGSVTPRLVIPATYSYGDVWGYGKEALSKIQQECNDNPMFEMKPLDYINERKAKADE